MRMPLFQVAKINIRQTENVRWRSTERIAKNYVIARSISTGTQRQTFRSAGPETRTSHQNHKHLPEGTRIEEKIFDANITSGLVRSRLKFD